MIEIDYSGKFPLRTFTLCCFPSKPLIGRGVKEVVLILQGNKRPLLLSFVSPLLSEIIVTRESLVVKNLLLRSMDPQPFVGTWFVARSLDQVDFHS
jgi:hypothetical protein